MKKFVAKVLALVLSLTFAVGVFAACDWISLNTERDLDQIVATVQIVDDMDAQDISKRELKTRYMSYEYQYLNYGYTSSEAYKIALENLVNNKIIVQKARIDLADTYNKALRADRATLDDFTVYFIDNALAGTNQISYKEGEISVKADVPVRGTATDLAQYLTEYEYLQAYYNVRVIINKAIDSLVEEEEEEEEENEVISFGDRTAPTVEDDSDEDEEYFKTDLPTYQERLIASVTLGDDAFDQTLYSNVYDLNKAVYENYEIDIDSSSARRSAYETYLETIKEAGYVSSSEKYEFAYHATKNPAGADNILNYDYFKNMIRSQMETLIVYKYQDSLVSGVRQQLTGAAMWDQYKVDYNAQKALYQTDYSAYESALESASETSLVLYNPYENYGYVSNILIGFSTEQTAAFNAYKAKAGVTQAQIDAFRNTLYAQIDAFDQRANWVKSNHGVYDSATNTFEFEDVYLIDTASDVLDSALKNFIGEIDFKDSYEKETDSGAKITFNLYNSVEATKIPFATFMSDYMSEVDIDNVIFDKDDASTVKRMGGYSGTELQISEEDLDSLKQLSFVFSTDTGILSQNYGYLYSPYTSAGKYVTEFAEAAKAVVEAGVGSYTVVGTDYGYHILVCTKIVSDEYDIDSAAGETAFLADLDVEGSLAYLYKQVKYDALTENEITRVLSKYVNDTLEDETKVVYYEDNYSDLVTEEE